MSFSKMFHRTAIHFLFTWNSADWKDPLHLGLLLLWMESEIMTVSMKIIISNTVSLHFQIEIHQH